MSKYRSRPGRRGGSAAVLGVIFILLIACIAVFSLAGRVNLKPASREVTLRVAYSPEKQELFEQLARTFNDRKPRLPSGKRVTLVVTPLNPDEMADAAVSNTYQAVSPDSSLWLGDIDRAWAKKQGTDAALVGETTRYMVSPVVIAMWKDEAASLGYPDKELGWQSLLKLAAERSDFKWSHPSTSSASGLLATLAEFYAGAGVTRDLTEQAATAPETLAYVTKLEKTVKHYGEGELAVIQQVEQEGRGYLDAFIVQEQMVLRYNAKKGPELVAIYPSEGTLWEDHPLALLEHPERTDEERLAYSLLKQFLLSHDTQMAILRQGYRPTDLTIRLDEGDSPIVLANGVDPARPYTTLQVPSNAVITVVKNVWAYTKRHTNIYLIADVSGSMQGQKLQDAKAALKTFVAQIPSDMERVGLIAFSSSVAEPAPLAQLGEGRGQLDQAIDMLSASGNTALLDAIQTAYVKLEDLHDTERINAIVVMTDGKENASRTRLRDLTVSLQQKSDLPIVVFCIAYGSDADIKMLESISSASGGFTKRGDPETIKNLYKTLSTYF